ncbi:MAG: Rieske 2Fe-2S domain-containing protein [Rhodanobacteraceae bacterium]|nr:Rieske 2Fe-2S domain-containing protein [Xanthomonadales bacterium]MCP5478151.1 Rieske 2Fe-2S domain-containing protein [Rhodanobacteraceae bacterium]
MAECAFIQYRDAREPSQVTDDLPSAAVQPASVPLCTVDAVPEGGALAATAMIDGEEESLILLRRDGAIGAFLNVCPHAGRRLDWAPGEFLFSSGKLVCAAHGATFSVPDGLCVAGPCRGESLREVSVEIRDGAVFLA